MSLNGLTKSQVWVGKARFVDGIYMFPASLHHYVNNVGATLVLLCFAGQWPPQHKKS